MGFQLNAAVVQKQHCVPKTGQLRLVNGIIFHCCHNGGREVLPFTALDKLEQLVDQIFHQLLHEIFAASGCSSTGSILPLSVVFLPLCMGQGTIKTFSFSPSPAPSSLTLSVTLYILLFVLCFPLSLPLSPSPSHLYFSQHNS
ncbi:tRNA pseudouridine synthase [Trichinella spiralis]|uniref:tRNA pseudouridine synthase n=1 Tax=Trichinella spiralis TaxID=6334 RepID=A0ABR3KZF4_TRISP